MAGISFLRARSPVTPNMTRMQGPATRGMRRSRGSRRGLPAASSLIAAILFRLRRRSRPARRRQLGAERVEHLLPGGRELGHALLFQHGHHVLVTDAELFQIHEELPGLLVAL